MKHHNMITILLPAILVACGAPATESANDSGTAAGDGSENATMAVSTAMSTNNQTQVATNEPLSVYIGHDPNEEVDGVMFANHPLVRGAVESAVPDPAIRHWILRQGTAAPISLRGGRLVSNVCEPHNCGPHNWTILIDPAGTSAEVCYAVNSTGQRSTWYAAGKPPEERPGPCPTS